MPTFGTLLRKARTAAKKTLRDTSRLLSISIPYMSDIERDRRNPPSEETIRTLARYLETPPEPLLAAAARSRGSLEVPKKATTRQFTTAHALMRRLTDLDDDELSQIDEILARRKEQT